MFDMDCCRGEMTGRPSDEDHFHSAGRGIMLMYPDDTIIPSSTSTSSSSSPSNPFPPPIDLGQSMIHDQIGKSDLQSVS
ncbi:hypothetical protein GE21DRAFT_1208262 [Neurospora crassa]|nr:hypothetical protein GE21DRAFT_1208262 [Neurospora crassa]